MKVISLTLATLLLAPGAYAQSEGVLRDFFEGKTIVVKIDMPATAQGVDLNVDARRPLDFERYGRRLKTVGTAIGAGESVMVTKVRVKDDLIEFQLGGGGFGTFSDDTSTSVYVPPVTKSAREKSLERDVRNERDAQRKRRLQEELDDLRHQREREDQRNRAAAATAEEEKKQRIADQRLHGGSRFNIRYQSRVPPGVTPADVMAVLSEYVEFPFADVPRTSAPAPTAAAPPAPPATVRKGMTLQEAEAVLGRAERTADRMEGKLKVTTAIFSRDDQRIEAEFVEGVLIRYSISSK